MSEVIETAIKQYNVTDSALAEIKQLQSIVVSNPQDKENYELAKVKHIELKKMVSSVEAKRKELKADSLEYGRRVDAEAKRIKGEIEPVLDHLNAQRKVVEDEAERQRKIKEEEERKLNEECQRRTSILISLGFLYTPGVQILALGEQQYNSNDLKKMSPDDFESIVAVRQEQIEAVNLAKQEDQNRIDEENRIERERLAKIAKEQEEKQAAIDAENARIKKEQEDAQAKIDAELKRIEDEKIAEQQRKENEAREAKQQETERRTDVLYSLGLEYDSKIMAFCYGTFTVEAGELFELSKTEFVIELQKIETEIKALKEEEAKEVERRIKEEEARIEAMKPDMEKIEALRDAFAAIEMPDVTTGYGLEVLGWIGKDREDFLKKINYYLTREK